MSKWMKLVLAGWLLALGVVLPLAFGQLPQIGRMLLPMHIPVFLCAFLCGKRYAVGMAALMPLVRYAFFSLPAFPLIIAGELATYALVAALLYERQKAATPKAVYGSLLVSMLCGRVVRVVLQVVFLCLTDGQGAIPMFFTETLLLGLVGAGLHLLVVPPLVLVCQRFTTGKGMR